MINRQALLSDLQNVLRNLEADLLERSESAEIPDVGQSLRAEYDRAKKAERTAQNYEDWRSDAITQAAAAWVLSCVFVRFLEDNKLIDPPKIAGVVSGQSSVGSGSLQNRLQMARDEHELYFRAHPTETDREYLLAVFDELATLPGGEIFSHQLSALSIPATDNCQLPTDTSRNWLSGDAAGELLRFFQKIEANTGDLIHDFTDPQWDTRFLGDLYQDLSEAARKKYALLQTPEFVEEFILDRTLEPALDEFGLEPHAKAQRREEEPESTSRSDFAPSRESFFKMIDPACGSGHFLLGSFLRILKRWQEKEPGTNVRALVQRTLDSIFGIDVNPFAVAIARFRLLLAALKTCGVMKLDQAPAFQVNLVCGDSLYHGRERQRMLSDDWTDEAHYFAAEDPAALRSVLREGTYHCVVANPPYITPKDRAANQAYRKLYPKTCHRQYSLAVPFMERIYRLAVPGGFTGQITANSFMKREFGKKLIESFFPSVDLTHVIDTSGAYIPGHGTPTVILFGRHRKPVAGTIRAVMGIRGEPRTPDDPSHGLVWSAIVAQIDKPGSQSDLVSVSDPERERFHEHPWSIGGGGAAELKERLDEATKISLSSLAESIGITSFTLEDDIYILPEPAAPRSKLRARDFREMVVGNALRDWTKAECEVAVFPYDADFQSIVEDTDYSSQRYLWIARTCLANNKMFGGKTKVETGLKWYEYGRLTSDKLRTPLSIVFAFVATHNHFVLDRGGKVFKQSAPVIKLPCGATENDHIALLGLLNSSSACFWMKQVFHDKGSTVDGKGARQTTVAFENFREFTGTGLLKFPLPADRPFELARRLDELARQLQAAAPGEVLTQRRKGAKNDDVDEPLRTFAPLREVLDAVRTRYEQLRGQMIFLQEELDWACYRLYGLVIGHSSLVIGEGSPNGQELMTNDQGLSLGQRAFEIVLARRMAAGETQTTWFERHGSSPITELPADWPDDYRQTVEHRIALIENDPNIRLIEQPEYKRRWNTESWESQVERALRSWLLNRLESYFDFDGRMNDEGVPTTKLDVALSTVVKLADVARQDPQFMEVGAVYRDDSAFDVQRLVAELVQAESVPLLPVLRYKPAGLRKRQEWEKTWDLQRQEDAIDARTQLPKDDPQYLTEDQARDLKQREIGDIPVPPKYKSSDFITTGGARYWALRGKLDVPKERWVSFPHCEGPDGTLVIAWAGYDHLQLARAISAYFVDIQQRLGGRDDPRLVPLLACIIELLPWLKQWHAGLDPDYNQRMDEVFEGFVTEEAKNLGLTIEEIKAWQPPKKAGRQKRK